MGVREKMLKDFGASRLTKPVSRDEFYSAVDVITDAFQGLKRRVEAVEGEKGIKPRVRVPAGSSRDAG